MSNTQQIEANRGRKRKKSKEKIAKLKAGTLGKGWNQEPIKKI